MPYGTIKVDTITFTAGGIDTSVSISGLVQNPTFTGNITSTGTISGNIIQGGTTVSGATVTGTAGQFGTLTGNTAGFTTVTGTTITGTTANLVTVSGTTVTGGTARFTTLTGISGVFTTAISGATVTGNTGQFTVVTGGTAGFTTVTGTTVTGTTANFTTLSGTTATITSGVFASGTAAAPSVSVGTTTNGLFSSGANEVAISTGGSGRLFVNSSGNTGFGTSSPNATGFASTVATINIAAGSNGGLELTKNNVAAGHFTVESNANNDIRVGAVGASAALTFQTAGSERLRITSAGLVGIGTSSPGVRCEIKGSNVVEPNSISNFLTYGAFRVQTSSSADTKSFAIAGGPSGLVSLQNVNDSSTAGPLAINPFGGNVGIGTTSPSGANLVIDTESNSGSGIRLIGKSANDGSEIDFYADNNSTRLGYIEYNNTSTTLNSETNVPVRFFQNGGEAFRVDTSKRLLVGTSSYSDGATLVLQGNSTNSSWESVVRMLRNISNPAADNALGTFIFGVGSAQGAQITASTDAQWGTNDYPTRLTFSVTQDGSSSPTERMRINNLGGITQFSSSTETCLVLGTASGAGTSVALLAGVHSRTNTQSGGTTSFIVFSNGNVQNTNGSYTAISDVKLKENVVDASSQWNDLKAIKIRNWNFKAETGHETHRQIGPIAQEVETVCPGLVFETPDRDADGNETGEVTKGVNQSVLYMKAVKALQEAMERIEQLEAKVAALESA